MLVASLMHKFPSNLEHKKLLHRKRIPSHNILTERNIAILIERNMVSTRSQTLRVRVLRLRRSSRIAAMKAAATAATLLKKSSIKQLAKKHQYQTVKKHSPHARIARSRIHLKTKIDPYSAIGASGTVDPECSDTGDICILDHEPCDAMLVLVDPAKNMDKFFILQLFKSTSGSYMVYSRWGRTGTTGQALEQSFVEQSAAFSCFEKKFEDKTGLLWKDRAKPTVGNKYRFIKQNFYAKNIGFIGAHWQYWVDDGVDGKRDGWYDYTAQGSMQVERLFQEHSLNAGLTNRLVDSGAWTYDVNLIKMTQTNIKHCNHTSRRIRRCPTFQ